MNRTKTIVGIEVDVMDDYKASVHLAHKLGERVFSKQLTALEAEDCLDAHFGGEQFKQSREVLMKVSSGQKLPVFLIIKRPGWNMMKAYWQEHRFIAVCLAASFAYLLHTFLL